MTSILGHVDVWCSVSHFASSASFVIHCPSFPIIVVADLAVYSYVRGPPQLSDVGGIIFELLLKLVTIYPCHS
jgi:hypothetical protein